MALLGANCAPSEIHQIVKNLVDFNSSGTEVVDGGRVTVTCLDLCKAFVSVAHNILVSKIEGN